ncbi:MAG: hypothetical protein ACKPKO_57605, partial [Candidatus Fonsibacter sp.]
MPVLDWIFHRLEGIAYEAEPRHDENLQAMCISSAHAVSALWVLPVGCEVALLESGVTEEQTKDLRVFFFDGIASGQHFV